MNKKIPEHIYPLWDEGILQWGMWNNRLHQWVGKDPDFGHAVFSSKEEAIEWFKEQI